MNNLIAAAKRDGILSQGNWQFIVFLIIGLHLCITIPLAVVLNIWIDEAYSLITSGKDIGYAIVHAIQYEVQPPLYFALLNLWRSFNDSILFARLFSILCVSLTIYTTALISRRYIKTIHPGWLTAVIAFHPYTIYAAVEIRIYPLTLLISALLLLFFFDGYLADTTNHRGKFLYGIFTIVGICTNYLLACITISHGLTLLILKRWRDFYSYLITMAVVVIFLIPLLLALFAHISRLKGVYANYSNSFIYSLTEIITRYLNYLIPDGYGWTAFTIAKILRYILPGLFIFILFRYRRFINSKFLNVLILNSTSIIVLVTVLYIMNAANLSERYAYPIFIISLLIMFALLSLIPHQLQIKSLMIWTCLSLFFSLSSLFSIYSPLAKEGDWQRVASYIMANEQPNQAILVFLGEGILPLSYYYYGVNPIVPIPRAMSIEKYDLPSMILQNEADIMTPLSQVTKNPESLWVITQFHKYIKHPTAPGACEIFAINFNCQVLEEFIDKYYAVKQQQKFYHSNVRFLEKKGDP